MAITTLALAFASRWFDEATVSRVFEPLVADWQREWLNAAHRQRWWVLLRGASAFVCAVAVSSPRVVREPVPAGVMNRVVVRVSRFAALATIVMIAPYPAQVDVWTRGLLLLLLVPGALAVALPFAMIAAVDAIRCDHALRPNVERAAAAKAALVACAIMLVLMGWGVPAANQAWRTQMAPAGVTSPARGVRELTITELITDPALATAPEGTNADGRAEIIVRELNVRVSLALLPALLIWLRWRILDLPRRRWSPLPPSVVAIAAIAGYVLLRNSDRIVEDVFWLRRGYGPWSPLVVVSILMLLEGWRRSRVRVIA